MPIQPITNQIWPNNWKICPPSDSPAWPACGNVTVSTVSGTGECPRHPAAKKMITNLMLINWKRSIENNWNYLKTDHFEKCIFPKLSISKLGNVVQNSSFFNRERHFRCKQQLLLSNSIISHEHTQNSWNMGTRNQMPFKAFPYCSSCSQSQYNMVNSILTLSWRPKTGRIKSTNRRRVLRPSRDTHHVLIKHYIQKLMLIQRTTRQMLTNNSQMLTKFAKLAECPLG